MLTCRRDSLFTLIGVATAALMTGLSGSGCASKPAPSPAGRLEGRLMLQRDAQGTSPAQRWSAGFELRGSAQEGELDLTSPLGTVLARARWNPVEAALDQGGEQRRFDGLMDLSRQLLGEPVPLQALFDWLQGRPWPGAAHAPSPQGFVQGGWAVDLTALAQGVVSARRDAAPSLSLRIRLEPGS